MNVLLSYIDDTSDLFIFVEFCKIFICSDKLFLIGGIRSRLILLSIELGICYQYKLELNLWEYNGWTEEKIDNECRHIQSRDKRGIDGFKNLYKYILNILN